MSERGTQAERPDALHQLRRRNKVRRWIEAMIAAGGPTDAEVDRLLDMARDSRMWRWRERAAACWYLGRTKHAGDWRRQVAQALADILGDTDSGRRQRSARAWIRTALCLALVLVMLGPLGLDPDDPPAVLIEGLMLLAAALFPPLVSGEIERARLDWVRCNAALGLEALAYPELLAQVVHAVGERRDDLRLPAWRAACTMLRATTPAHYGHLGGAVTDVCDFLRSRDPATLVVVIDALGRFGDGRAVAPIESLLQRQDLPPEAVEAAEKALPVLRLRREQEGSDARLLRPAASPEDGATLLRPAAGAGPGDEELLLRPADGAGDD